MLDCAEMQSSCQHQYYYDGDYDEYAPEVDCSYLADRDSVHNDRLVKVDEGKGPLSGLPVQTHSKAETTSSSTFLLSVSYEDDVFIVLVDQVDAGRQNVAHDEQNEEEKDG